MEEPMSDRRKPLPGNLTRRRFLQGSAIAGVSAFLAACTGGNSTSPSASTATAALPSASPATTASPSASATASESVAPTPQPSPTGPLEWAQWPAYIDLTGKAGEEGVYAPGSSPTLEAFKSQYKVDVNYQEKVEANEDFYATIQPQLQGGLPTGWDLITVTDWLAAKIISKGWAEKIDQANVPNCTANLRDPLRNQTWDPGNDYHYPWQSGMTGIGYNTQTLAAAKVAEPKSLADLWAIRSDKVTFLSEKRDTFALGLLKLGKNPDPATTTDADLQAVHDDMKPLVDKGLRITGNEYLQDFAAKKVWAAMVWSGDLASSGTEGDTFAFPTEGNIIWTDNLLIPKGASNKYTAELMMNFVYDPKIAGQIANYVYYVSPVEGAKEVLEELNKDAPLDQAHLDLLFPPEEVVAKQHNLQFLSDELEAKMNELYADLAGV
jgi:spermidine/putrescine transport system substrate-binding protein